MASTIAITLSDMETLKLLNLCAAVGAKHEIQLIVWALAFYEQCHNLTKNGDSVICHLDKNSMLRAIDMVSGVQPDATRS